METNPLSDKITEQEQTPEQIFSEMSEAVKANDTEALDRLTKDTPVTEAIPEVKEVITPDPAKEGEVGGSTEVDPNAPVLDEKDKTINQLKEELAQQSRQVHQLRSDAGRVPALQRRLSELDKKLQEMATKPVTAASAREDSRVLNEKLAQIKEADPLLADAVEEAINNAIDNLRHENEEKLAKTNEFLQQRVAKEEDEFLDREYDRLVKAVPNAPEVFAHPLWAEWKTQIPPNLLSLATSAYADEVMVAFEQFSKFVLARHPELAQAKQEEVKPAAPQVVDPAAAKIVADRDKKLKTPTPGSSSPIAEKDNEPTDPEKLFAHFYKQELKNQGR